MTASPGIYDVEKFQSHHKGRLDLKGGEGEAKKRNRRGGGGMMRVNLQNSCSGERENGKGLSCMFRNRMKN